MYSILGSNHFLRYATTPVISNDYLTFDYLQRSSFLFWMFSDLGQYPFPKTIDEMYTSELSIDNVTGLFCP